LGEKQQRIVLAAEAKALGHGGITAVAEAAGISRPVIYRGLRCGLPSYLRRWGGSNGYRTRLWKLELQKFADETGLEVTVSHFPPGTSKWNKIEHRLFSFITMNWRGRPLVSHEVMVQLIQGTTARTGLKVRAALDTGSYPTKIKVSDEEFAQIKLSKHKFHGEWNYTISPHDHDAKL